MVQPSAKSVLVVSVLAGFAAIPGLIYAIVQISKDPSNTYSYIYLISSIFVIAIIAGYIVQLFAFGRSRIPPESDY
jgi:hypothetical protein